MNPVDWAPLEGVAPSTPGDGPRTTTPGRFGERNAQPASTERRPPSIQHPSVGDPAYNGRPSPSNPHPAIEPSLAVKPDLFPVRTGTDVIPASLCS